MTNNDNSIENMIIMTSNVMAYTVYTIINNNDKVHRQWFLKRPFVALK